MVRVGERWTVGMRFKSNRKVTPKVVNGHIQKKNRHDLTASIWTTEDFIIEKERPGRGYRHILSKADLLSFFQIIPDWESHCQGLLGVRLTAGESGFDGLYYYAGIICIPAWERDHWRLVTDSFFQEHRALFNRLGVPHLFRKGVWELQFTEETVRAYQLLHIFLHELGHHRDRMSTRKRELPSRGENFAESWAYTFERKVWDGYQEEFGIL